MWAKDGDKRADKGNQRHQHRVGKSENRHKHPDEHSRYQRLQHLTAQKAGVGISHHGDYAGGRPAVLFGQIRVQQRANLAADALLGEEQIDGKHQPTTRLMISCAAVNTTLDE